MIYCISDIHACICEFKAMLKKIKFCPETDTLYILGDAIDRGPDSLGVLRYIMDAKSIHLLMGNHEQMMLDFYDKYSPMDVDELSRLDIRGDIWFMNGCRNMLEQLSTLPKSEQLEILSYVSKLPYSKTLDVDGRQYFLSHAGLDPARPVTKQTKEHLLYSREEFYEHKAQCGYTCIFGHTPTRSIRRGRDNSIWHDPLYLDKICIDCGCVFGGVLAALRLDDSKEFYVLRHILDRHSDGFY